MGVTGIQKSYFVVWTAHGIFTELLTFDNDLWENMKYPHYFHSFLQYYLYDVIDFVKEIFMDFVKSKQDF